MGVERTLMPKGSFVSGLPLSEEELLRMEEHIAHLPISVENLETVSYLQRCVMYIRTDMAEKREAQKLRLKDESQLMKDMDDYEEGVEP